MATPALAVPGRPRSPQISRTRVGVETALFWGVVAVLWEVVPRVAAVPPILFPPLSQVIGSLVNNAGAYASAGLLTLVEFAGGMAIGTSVGFLIGIGVFYSAAIRRSIYPLLLGFRVVPKLAFVPLFLIWFGVGPESKVAVAALAVAFVIVVQTVLGLHAADVELLELGRSLRMSELMIFRQIRLPAAAPALLVGLKLGSQYALLNVVVAEMVVSAEGLGSMIGLAASRFQTSAVLAGIAVTIAFGLVLYGVTLLAERRLTFWYRET